MRLSDIYKHKKNNSIIQIECFASDINNIKDMIIVYSNIFNNSGEIGSCPSFNGFGTQEEIENIYELLVPQDKIRDYESWDEIFELIKEN